MNNNSPHKLLGIAIHVVIWTVILAMPYLVAYFTNTTPPPIDVGMFMMPMQVMIAFYINYCWLINKFLFKRRLVLFMAINAIIIPVMVIAIVYLRETLFMPENMPDKEEFTRMRMIAHMLMIAVSQFFVVGISVAIKMTIKWYEVRQRLQELERANAEVELTQLKSQLNPHFLFNSLNNIYALIAFDQDKAQLSLHSLCDMLRYQLYEANRETIPLSKELEFVRSYCDLMQLRLAKNVSLNVNLTEDTTGVSIAPLMFVSIVENAFKHGISQNEPSYITIKISVEQGVVNCQIKNSYYPKTDSDRSGSGIGLENLSRRLELIYPESHSFRAEKIGSEFTTQLTINTQHNDKMYRS